MLWGRVYFLNAADLIASTGKALVHIAWAVTASGLVLVVCILVHVHTALSFNVIHFMVSFIMLSYTLLATDVHSLQIRDILG